MFNQTIDIQLVQSWQKEKCPSDVVVNQSGKTWFTTGDKAAYWEHIIDGTSKKQTTDVEVYKIETAPNGFYILSYNTDTRENEAWFATSLNMADKTKLNIDDPVDIAYAADNQQLYWTTHAKKIMVYKEETKTSDLLSETLEAASCLLSANGKYLALKDSKSNFYVWDLNKHQVIVQKNAAAGLYYSLVGVTDHGELVLCTKGVVRKDNSQSNPKNQILSIARDGSSTLVLEAAIVWARLAGKYLTTWNEGKLSVYRTAAL